MYLDKNLEFDPATAITVTRDSTNVIDLGVGREIGIAVAEDKMKVALFVTTTFAAVGAATLGIALQFAPDNGSGAAGTFATVAELTAIALAGLVANQPAIEIDVPVRRPGVVGLPRFLKLVYTVSTGPFTAGVMQAELTPGSVDQMNTTGYPSGFTVAN